LLKKKTKWKYFFKSNKNIYCLYIEIKPQKSLQDIICILENFSSNFNFNSNKAFDKSNFYKIIKGQRLSAYGWSLYFIYL
jgi:hypothetical protein